jgi:hypothetical protein
MAATVHERLGSRQINDSDDPNVDFLYWINGTSDEAEAEIALAAAAPTTYSGLVPKSAHLERVGEELFSATVVYGRRAKRETGDSSYNFDTTGGTAHLTQSLDTVAAHAPAGRTAPDFGGAIGVTRDSVQGVDITSPAFSFSETHYLDVALITPAYKLTLFGLTGAVNLDTFRGFAPGECLFLGASGAIRGEEDWEITYRFSASPNAVGLTAGDIQIASKRGFDYLWIRYEDTVDDDAGAIVKRPAAAYIEQVYPYGIFANLGI